MIDKELLDEEIQAYKEQGKESQVNQELIDFLRQKVRESEFGDLLFAIL